MASIYLQPNTFPYLFAFRPQGERGLLSVQVQLSAQTRSFCIRSRQHHWFTSTTYIIIDLILFPASELIISDQTRTFGNSHRGHSGYVTFILSQLLSILFYNAVPLILAPVIPFTSYALIALPYSTITPFASNALFTTLDVVAPKQITHSLASHCPSISFLVFPLALHLSYQMLCYSQ